MFWGRDNKKIRPSWVRVGVKGCWPFFFFYFFFSSSCCFSVSSAAAFLPHISDIFFQFGSMCKYHVLFWILCFLIIILLVHKCSPLCVTMTIVVSAQLSQLKILLNFLCNYSPRHLLSWALPLLNGCYQPGCCFLSPHLSLWVVECACKSTPTQ